MGKNPQAIKIIMIIFAGVLFGAAVSFGLNFTIAHSNSKNAGKILSAADEKPEKAVLPAPSGSAGGLVPVGNKTGPGNAQNSPYKQLPPFTPVTNKTGPVQSQRQSP